MTKRLFILAHPEARRRACQAVAEAPEGYTVTIAEPRRNGEQNAMFHALCGAIAKSGMQWGGKPRTLEQWKVLLVSGHAVATKEGHDMLPGIEGEFVNLRESTALMSKKRTASLIDYTLAFCAAHGIETEEAHA